MPDEEQIPQFDEDYIPDRYLDQVEEDDKETIEERRKEYRARRERSERLVRRFSAADTNYEDALAKITGCDPTTNPQDMDDSSLPVIVDATDLGKVTTQRWLVDGILPTTSLAMMFGAEASGKSFAVLDLLLSISTDEPFLGHKIIPGPCLYITGEGISGLGNRATAWSLGKMGSHYLLHCSDLFTIPDPMQLDTKEGQADLLRALFYLKRYRFRLIVIDTLHACVSGLDENASDEVGSFLKFINQVKLLTGACILVVHHSRKGSKEYRGHSSLAGAMDTMIHVHKRGHYVTLSCRKQKDGEDFDDMQCELKKFNIDPTRSSCYLDPIDRVHYPVADLLYVLGRNAGGTTWSLLRDQVVNQDRMSRGDFTATFQYAVKEQFVVNKTPDKKRGMLWEINPAFCAHEPHDMVFLDEMVTKATAGKTNPNDK